MADFTARCAIHASAPYMWRRLISFGLKADPIKPMHSRNATNKLCMVVEDGIFYNVSEDTLLGMADYIYDCKDNKDLFFALAPMRKDSDIHQWFIFDNRAEDEENGRRFWFVCKRDSVEDDMFADDMFEYCEKATVKELIAHFNDWDDDEVAINLM